MREVKFRGQDCFGNWQFGSLVTDNKTYWFIRNSVCDVSVDPKTVGQYTGLKDKNGFEIYEVDTLNDASGKYMKYEIVEKCEGKLPIHIVSNRSFNELE